MTHLMRSSKYYADPGQQASTIYRAGRPQYFSSCRQSSMDDSIGPSIEFYHLWSNGSIRLVTEIERGGFQRRGGGCCCCFSSSSRARTVTMGEGPQQLD
jgi:hypothetical protein